MGILAKHAAATGREDQPFFHTSQDEASETKGEGEGRRRTCSTDLLNDSDGKRAALSRVCVCSLSLSRVFVRLSQQTSCSVSSRLRLHQLEIWSVLAGSVRYGM